MMKMQQIKLGEAATFVNGYAFKPNQWKTHGKEIIRIQNLTNSSTAVNYFDGVLPDKYKVTKGDLLISWSATLGVFEWKKDDAWLNQHIFKVIFDKYEFEKRFFYYLISYSLNQLEKEVHGSTMKHITKKRFDNIIIPLPPLETQKKIAAKLDKANELRQNDKKILEKYDQLAQSVFLEMFGDLVNNQMGWPLEKFGSIFRSLKYGVSTPPIYSTNGTPFIRATNIKGGGITKNGMVYISNIEASKIEKCRLDEGDLIIVRSGANTGDCSRIPKEYQDAYGGFDIIIKIEIGRASCRERV